MTKIYTLCDPITKEIRYIGKTNYSLSDRLCKHLITYEKNHRSNWINSLLKKGFKPEIELLEEVDSNNWQIHEIYWISQFKAWGFRLVNLTEGGESGIISKQCRKAQIKAVTGKIQTKESIEKRIKHTVKPVLSFTKEGIFVKEYPSVSEAARKISGCLSHITECCNGISKRKTHKKMIWKYK